MTKKKKEEQKKRELAEAEEYLRQVEVPESQGGGYKYVSDQIDEERKEEQKEKDDTATDLQGKADKSYLRGLADYGYKLLGDADFGEDWEYYCIPTDGAPINIFGKRFGTKRGVLVIVKSPRGDVFVRGVGITKVPEIDMKAVSILVVQAENTVDSQKGILLSDKKRTKSGIYMP